MSRGSREYEELINGILFLLIGFERFYAVPWFLKLDDFESILESFESFFLNEDE